MYRPSSGHPFRVAVPTGCSATGELAAFVASASAEIDNLDVAESTHENVVVDITRKISQPIHS